MSVVNLFQQIAQNDFGFFQQVRTAADVMTAAPPCLTLDDTFADADALLKKHSASHAPVLNPEDNSLVGVVSDRDLLRFRPRLLGKAAEGDEDHKALKNAVTKFMTRNPVWCTTDASSVEVMTLMLDHHIDSVIVSSDGKTLDGIITPNSFIQTLLLYHRVCTRDFNLRRLRLVDLDLKDGIPLDEMFSRGAQTVRDVMTKDVVSLKEDDDIETAMGLMQEHEIRHLPILSTSDSLIGMLSDREILKVLPVPDQCSEGAEQPFRQSLFACNDKATLRIRVDTLMSSGAALVNADMLLTDALAMLQAQDVSGVPVSYADNGKLCGILTTSDILRVFRVVMQIGSLSDKSAVSD